ncbi:MAG: thiamine pyrophosphate-binding protein [Chloroflexi bacterium]|nr:thiamine pyrophosphate-binding protein [Chloroflexota bacterium]MCH8283225.1 thiamine pyrophosphate-binding protein [Chloroflexota bacterium]MCI0770089.1 thiamine pyrophosphate-binding protein [Chloroflexota bacterium]
MADVTGSHLVARALQNEGVETLFYLMGGPISPIITEAEKLGLKAYYVRHEQAAAMAAHAYARATGKTGVCVTTSGPGTANAITGIANAQADACPVICLGGSVNVESITMDAFQEMDQVPMFKSITKLAFKADLTHRLPEYLSVAFRHAQDGCKGAVYVDLPGDVLNGKVDDETVLFPTSYRVESRSMGDPALVRRAIDLLAKAERPVVVSGSGILWSEASDEYRAFIDATGIPFYTTPQGRGAIAEDHDLVMPGARSQAFREADVVLVLGTRANAMLFNFQAPRFNANAKFIEVNIDGKELGHNRPVDVGILGDAKMVIQQLTEEAQGRIDSSKFSAWVDNLRAQDAARAERSEALLNSDQTPIHPLRLCKELREVMSRETILVVDGHEILGFARHSIPTYLPRHRINAGPHGCMGVGVPFGLGAQAAHPDKQVVVLSGDGAFGWNGMEMDTAVRLNLPIKVVISNNAGFTGRGSYGSVGRELGWQRYDKMMEAIGCHGEWVEEPDDIRPALERAFAADGPAVVNVKTEPTALAGSAVGM